MGNQKAAKAVPFPPQRTQSPGARRDVILGLLLIAATLAVYLRVCGFEFIDLDDPDCIVRNLHVIRGLNIGGIRWAFTTLHFANWMPLTWLSYMLDATIYGAGPGGYHFTNLLIHVANVLLVFRIFAVATGNSLRSAFVAALFAVHPLNVESVAWIAERKGLLSMLFGLLSLYAYVRYVRRPRFATLGLSFVFFVCSLLSKQTFVTLPFVFLLLDYWPLGRLSEGSKRARLILEKLPFFAASAAFCVVAVVAQASGGAVVGGIPLTTRCLNVILAFGLCLRRTLVPYPLALFYPYAGAHVGLSGVALSLFVLAAITFLAIKNARRRPFLLIGWLWFLGTLVPMIGLVQIGGQQMPDRYAYFPLLGLFVAIAWLVPSVAPAPLERKHLLPIAAIGTLALYATVAFVQVSYWRDGATLFRHAMVAADDNPVAHGGLASALFRKKEFGNALVQIQQAIRLDPTDSKTHYMQGRILQGLNRPSEAAKEFQAAIDLDPANPDPHNDLGLILCARNQFADAKREFKRALELNGDFAEAYVNLGFACGQSGDYAQSIVCYERALELDRSLTACHRSIAICLAAEGRLDDAIKYLSAHAPDDRTARSELERVRASRGGRVVPAR